MRILVLGATGYVGSRLVPALLDAGHDVVAASSSVPNPGRAQLPPPVVGALPGAPPSAASIMRPPPGGRLRDQPALADRP